MLPPVVHNLSRAALKSKFGSHYHTTQRDLRDIHAPWHLKTSPLENHSFDLAAWLSKAKALGEVTPDSRHLFWSPTNSPTIPVSFDIWGVNTKYVNTLCRKNSGFLQCSSWLSNVRAVLDRSILSRWTHRGSSRCTVASITPLSFSMSHSPEPSSWRH